MKFFLKLLVLVVLILSISGCSKWFSIGTDLTYCEEHGCNYQDVGLCENPLEILKNKDDLSLLREKE